MQLVIHIKKSQDIDLIIR